MKEENKGKKWADEDLTLILSMVPSIFNRDHLAKMLGRTPRAIEFIWEGAYGTTKLLREEKGLPRLKNMKDKLGIYNNLCMVTSKSKSIIELVENK